MGLSQQRKEDIYKIQLINRTVLLFEKKRIKVHNRYFSDCYVNIQVRNQTRNVRIYKINGKQSNLLLRVQMVY